MSSFFSKHRAPKVEAADGEYWPKIHNMHHRVFLTLTRDQNLNMVVYTVNLDRKGKINIHNPIDAFWLDVDPTYDDGKTPQYSKLGLMDSYVYGYSISKVTNTQFNFVSKYKGVSGIVKLDKSGKPRLFINKNWVRHVHAHLDNSYSLQTNPFKFITHVTLVCQQYPRQDKKTKNFFRITV